MGNTLSYDQEPTVVASGDRWLAVSPEGAHPRIGVFGSTKAEAEARFQERLRVWQTWGEDASPPKQAAHGS